MSLFVIPKYLLPRRTIYVLMFCFPNFLSTSCFKVPKFSTKTPYHWVLNSRDPTTRVNQIENELDKCTPIHLNYLIRHGAREPSAKDVTKFSLMASKVIKELESKKEQMLHPLMEWTNRFIGNDKELVELGRVEQFNLGKRFGERFKIPLSKFENDGLQFVVSRKSRTKDSALSFYRGIMPALGLDITSEEGMMITLSDETIRFFDNCDKYLHDVDNNKTALVEYKNFRNGSLMKNLATKVTEKFQLKHNTLTPDEVNSLVYLCSLETAFYEKSDWCEFLEIEDLPIIEYLRDLKHYWKKGYGYEINYLQSCPLMEDIMNSINQAVEKYKAGDQYTTGLFRFGHAETLLPLYSLMGLFKDAEPLRADNYHQHRNREFLTSQICPFSANIGFVVYDCKEKIEATGGDNSERFIITTLLNELPIKLPGQDSILCPLSKFQQIYYDISTCNFENICVSSKQDATSKDEL